MVCTWCGISGEQDEEPQPLTEVKLDFSPDAVEAVRAEYPDDVICKRCYGAFIRGFGLGRKSAGR